MPRSSVGIIVQHENGSLVSDHYGNVIVFNELAAASQYMLKGSRTIKAVRFTKPRRQIKGDPYDDS